MAVGGLFCRLLFCLSIFLSENQMTKYKLLQMQLSHNQLHLCDVQASKSPVKLLSLYALSDKISNTYPVVKFNGSEFAFFINEISWKIK